MSQEKFPHLKIEGNRLTAFTELPFHGSELELACRELFALENKELTIDLSALNYVASPQIGALVAACARARQTGRKLHVIVSEELERFLGRMKLDGIIHYEVA